MRTLKNPAKRAIAATILASCSLGITAAANAATPNTTTSTTQASVSAGTAGPYGSRATCENARAADHSHYTTPCFPGSINLGQWYYAKFTW